MIIGREHSPQGEVSLYGWYPVLLDSTKKENKMLFHCSKATESKLVILETCCMQISGKIDLEKEVYLNKVRN